MPNKALLVGNAGTL